MSYDDYQRTIESQISETGKINATGAILEDNNTGVNPQVIIQGKTLTSIATSGSTIHRVPGVQQDEWIHRIPA